MIGVTHTALRTAIVNDPVTPVFTNTGNRTSTNTLGGNGSFQFSFNATKLTCGVNATGSVSGSGASSIQYFTTGSLIDPVDYEVQCTLGTNSGFSNIAAAGGSATLGVWHTLSTSPVFTLECSDRRGGSSPFNITIRHRVNTAVTATVAVTLVQSSDAVTPSFSGLSGTTTLTKSTADSYLGLYIDSDSSANAGRIRTYKNTTIDTNIGFTFSTGSIPESEYEFRFDSLSITPGGSLSFGGTAAGSYVDVSVGRSTSPSSGSGGRYYAALAAAAGVGVMRITVRHKLDQAKSASFDKTFQTS